MVRQWVEFYITRIRSETPWDAITNDQLKNVMEVRNKDIVVSYPDPPTPSTAE